MACGASDKGDNRKTPTTAEPWGSDFGPEMSVVAPGLLIPTIDRQGSDGYETGDYKSDFNGTSSATPQVAGLAALIKSLFPTLTNVQIRDRIERNADKVGAVPYSTTSGHPNGTWNQEMGYGRINALKSLIEPDNLWIAWKGSGNDQLNVMSVFEPNKKIILDETSDTSPSIACNVDLLRIAWKGSGNDQLNFIDDVFNPSTVVLNEESSHSPSVTEFNDDLRIAWKGSGNDQLNAMDVFNPSSKRVLNETSDVVPAITAFNHPA
jgi:Subtilase family